MRIKKLIDFNIEGLIEIKLADIQLIDAYQKVEIPKVQIVLEDQDEDDEIDAKVIKEELEKILNE